MAEYSNRRASSRRPVARLRSVGTRAGALDDDRALRRTAPLEPSPIRIGRYFDGERIGEPNLFAGERHLLIFGLNGAGKSTRFLIENLVTLRNRSIVVFNVKGELAAQTARTRRQFSDVKIINPYGVVDLPSDGYNPLAILDPDNENEFSDRAAMLADAIVEIEGKDPHWAESARGLMQAGIMWEVQEAQRERRAPSLFRVRQLLTEADDTAPIPDSNKRVLVKGLNVNATRMVAEGGEIIASLVGRFLRERGQDELASIQSTFDTQTQFLLSPPLARDLEQGEGDCFRQLRETPTTVYIVLPPSEINRKRRWTRLLIASALCEHMRPGPVKTLFVLDEFRASVGHLQIINDVWSLVRGYGIQLMPVVQSATQLKALYKDEWENFAAQAGAVVTIGPPNDLMTANWMSEISGTQSIWQDSRSSSESASAQGGGVNVSDGLNYQQSERRFILPQELRSMAVGTGRIWTPGMGESSIPFFAPNWWKCKELIPLVDPNPYYEDSAASSTAAPEPASQLPPPVATKASDGTATRSATKATEGAAEKAATVGWLFNLALLGVIATCDALHLTWITNRHWKWLSLSVFGVVLFLIWRVMKRLDAYGIDDLRPLQKMAKSLLGLSFCAFLGAIALGSFGFKGPSNFLGAFGFFGMILAGCEAYWLGTVWPAVIRFIRTKEPEAPMSLPLKIVSSVVAVLMASVVLFFVAADRHDDPNKWAREQVLTKFTIPILDWWYGPDDAPASSGKK